MAILKIRDENGNIIEIPAFKGDKGDTGPQGIQGPKGEDGTSVNIKGSVNTASELPTTGISEGDGYLTEDDGHLHVYNGSNFIDVGLIRGPQGTGVTAAGLDDNYNLILELSNGEQLTVGNVRGPQGVQGEKGDTGSQGPQGLQGEKGEPFTIAKVFSSIDEMNNTFNTDDVSEGQFVLITSSVDDEDNAKLFVKGSDEYVFLTDLSGAQGIKGEQGIQGIQGPAGTDGTNATIISATASVDANVGTPSVEVTLGGTENARTFNFDFKNLKGNAGAAGETGPKGETGVGIKSIELDSSNSDETKSVYNIVLTDNSSYPFTVNHGSDGKDGANGANGTNGTNGTDGEDGVGIAEIYIEDGSLYVRKTNETEAQNLGVVKGNDGSAGLAGTNATITGVSASVDSNVGTPSVTVSMGGTESARTFNFDFKNLKGASGTNGVDGTTPHIGDNGNWFIGTTDTGVSASGSGGSISDEDLEGYATEEYVQNYVNQFDSIALMEVTKSDTGVLELNDVYAIQNNANITVENKNVTYSFYSKNFVDADCRLKDWVENFYDTNYATSEEFRSCTLSEYPIGTIIALYDDSEDSYSSHTFGCDFTGAGIFFTTVYPIGSKIQIHFDYNYYSPGYAILEVQGLIPNTEYKIYFDVEETYDETSQKYYNRIPRIYVLQCASSENEGESILYADDYSPDENGVLDASLMMSPTTIIVPNSPDAFNNLITATYDTEYKVDQNYNEDSVIPQSGAAVAEALDSLVTIIQGSSIDDIPDSVTSKIVIMYD